MIIPNVLDGLLPAIMRFDVVGYIYDHGAVRIQEHEWSLICPSCGKDKLIVNTSKRTWHCWVCQQYESVVTSGGVKRRVMAGAGGLVDLIQLLENVDRVTAARKVIAAGHMTTKELEYLPEWLQSSSHVAPWADHEPMEISFPENVTGDMSHELVQNFLWRRGITKDDVYRNGLVWCWGGYHVGRFVFPVFENGRLVYWQARAMWDPVPGERYIKALNPPRSDGAAVSTDVLFNLDRARLYKRVAITEAPIDAIHVGDDAVATFGKVISPPQIGKLIRAGVRAIDFFWDADAYADAVHAAKALSTLFDVRIVQLPTGDPGDFTREQNAWYRDRGQRLPGLQVLA